MFLGKSTYQNAIKDMMREEGTLDIAVPALGNDAVALFSKSRNSRIRLVCNLQHGDSQPEAIAAISQLENVEVRNNPRLHARTLISHRSVIIGSANISTTGLSLNDTSSDERIEAGIIVDNPDTITQTRRWFADVWQKSEPLPAEVSAAAESAELEPA